MSTRDRPLTPELLIEAYAMGIFPMAESRDGPVRWVCPDPRGVMPLDERFHVPRSLGRKLGRFTITHDRAFERAMRACAEPRDDDAETWINDEIVRACVAMHEQGLAHSVEAWTEEGVLAGGIYGLSLGGAFFAESMFTRVTDASKVCLVRLVEHLRARQFALLDVQFVTPHLARFGAYELPREDYMRWLRVAMALRVRW